MTISIRDPELGDSERHDSNAIIRENRGLNAITFKDATWPINIIKSFTITTMTRLMKDEFVDFVKASAADEIFITDPLGQVWIGIITSPVAEIVTTRDNCSYDANFQLMGRKVS
jgi:hypothetical protein